MKKFISIAMALGVAVPASLAATTNGEISSSLTSEQGAFDNGDKPTRCINYQAY